MKLEPEENIFVDNDGTRIGVRHNLNGGRVWITGKGLGVIDMTPNQALILSHSLKKFAKSALGIEE